MPATPAFGAFGVTNAPTAALAGVIATKPAALAPGNSGARAGDGGGIEGAAVEMELAAEGKDGAPVELHGAVSRGRYPHWRRSGNHRATILFLAFELYPVMTFAHSDPYAVLTAATSVFKVAITARLSAPCTAALTDFRATMTSYSRPKRAYLVFPNRRVLMSHVKGSHFLKAEANFCPLMPRSLLMRGRGVGRRYPAFATFRKISAGSSLRGRKQTSD